MADLQLIRRSFPAFVREVAVDPLTEWQARALELAKKVTAIVAPRQSGKSRSVALLSLWWAFRRPGQTVLVVSASDDASKRLLDAVRGFVHGCELLRGAVVDETRSLITLSNGSEIRCIPASEKQARGWSVDLLVCDEASLIGDDLLLGAALPTTAARPDSRVVMVSSAQVASGAFFEAVQRGRAGDAHTAAFSWPLAQASWISPATIAAARASMSELRFRAEYLGEFSSSADSLFPRYILDAASAPVEFPSACEGAALLAGTDWGVTTDRSAIVAVGRLSVPVGVFVVAAAQRWPAGAALMGPEGVVAEIAAAPLSFDHLTSESNGVGAGCSQELARLLRGRSGVVRAVHTTSDMKASTFSSVRGLFEQGRLVLPEDAVDLRRELLMLRVELLPGGSERIEAGSGHDDLADALMLSAGPYRSKSGAWRSRLADAAYRFPPPGDESWSTGEVVTVRSGGGLLLPREPVLESSASGGGGFARWSRGWRAPSRTVAGAISRDVREDGV